MAFSKFKHINQVLKRYPLKVKQEKFLPKVSLDLPDWFLDNLKFSLDHQSPYQSEMFFRESFIFPFLQLVWKRYPKLELWSNQAIVYDDQLFGEPDYLVSVWRDEVVEKLVSRPLLAVTEAKKQDFETGWGQCLAELIACQKINQDENLTVYGIVSTGILWEFGKLSGNLFTRHSFSYTMTDAQKIFGVLDYIFSECEKQVS